MPPRDCRDDGVFLLQPVFAYCRQNWGFGGKYCHLSLPPRHEGRFAFFDLTLAFYVVETISMRISLFSAELRTDLITVSRRQFRRWQSDIVAITRPFSPSSVWEIKQDNVYLLETALLQVDEISSTKGIAGFPNNFFQRLRNYFSIARLSVYPSGKLTMFTSAHDSRRSGSRSLGDNKAGQDVRLRSKPAVRYRLLEPGQHTTLLAATAIVAVSTSNGRYITYVARRRNCW
ncbi:hypothetical protein J6590_044123, partial [Homalodisca vitripennis]